MRPKSILVAVASLACVGLLEVGHRSHRVAQALEVERTAAAARQATRQLELERERERTATAERALAGLRASLVEARAIPPAGVAVGPGAAPTPPPAPMPFSQQEVLRKDPKLQLLYLQSQRVSLAARYAPLLRRLGLSGPAVERFNELVLRQAERLIDIEGAAQTQALALDDPAIERLRVTAEQDLREAQRALLGDERYRQFEGMERILPARGVVDQVAGRLVFTSEPLHPEQAERLTEAFARASRTFRAGGKSDASAFNNDMLNFAANGSLQPDGWKHPHPDNFDWPAVMQDAGGILSPLQFTIFEAATKRETTAMQLLNLAQDARLRGELPVPAGVKPPGGG